MGTGAHVSPAGRVLGLVRAAHAPPTAVVTALGAAVAAAAGGSATEVLGVALAVLAGQLSVGWSNDWVDADRDRAVARPDKPVVAGLVSDATLRTAALVAAGVCVVLSFSTGLRPGLVHVAAVGVAWSYNLVLKTTVWSWVPYAVSFGLLPAFAVLAATGGPPAPGVLGAGALLGTGAHLANVLPDLEDDAATGVRGLPHRLGRTGCSVGAPTLLLGGVVVALAGSGRAAGGTVGWPAVLAAVAAVLALTAGVVAVVRPRSRAPFALTMVVAVLCVALLVTAGDGLAAATRR